MNIKIYQIDTNRDNVGAKFQPLDRLEGKKVDVSLYNEVFMGNVDSNTLEDVFKKFNTDGHPLHRGHPLSVSDVVKLEENTDNLESGFYYCDSIGFAKIDFDESLVHKQDNLMQVVYVEPHRKPFVSEIKHTLDAEQKAVGGLIELVYNEDGTAIICNEEGKLIGLDGNRRIGNGSSIIAGSFFVVGLTEDDFCSLTDEEAQKYMERFSKPEEIPEEDVQNDMGFTIYYG